MVSGTPFEPFPSESIVNRAGGLPSLLVGEAWLYITAYHFSRGVTVFVSSR